MTTPGGDLVDRQSLLDLVGRWAGSKILVYGDFVLDEFLYGRIDRISREAPVFIVTHQDSSFHPGCGANAVANLTALGADVYPCGVIGVDEPGVLLAGLLDSMGAKTDGLVPSADIKTATKTRVIAGSAHSLRQQIVRIDKLNGAASNPRLDEAVLARLRELLPRCRAVLISDYHIGGLCPRLGAELVRLAAGLGIPALVDSRHRMPLYRGATALTPNQPEVEECLGVEIGDLEQLHAAGLRLLETLGSRALVITRGGEGMTLFTPGADPVDIPAFGEGEVIDVSGAGDTVIAAFTLGVAAGADFLSAARLANVAGGLSVFKKGTSTVGADEIRAALERP